LLKWLAKWQGKPNPDKEIITPMGPASCLGKKEKEKEKEKGEILIKYNSDVTYMNKDPA
jgi:hypothetical protein